MGTQDDNDPFSSLFADALRAVEKVTDKEDKEDESVEIEVETEIAIDSDSEDSDDAIEIDFDESMDFSGAEDAAALEMKLLETEEKLQQTETTLKKALRSLKKKKKDGEALTMRMELLQKEIGRLRVSNQQASRQVEILENRSTSNREALDASNARVDQLNEAIEKHQYQLTRNQKLRKKEVEEAKNFGISPAILQFIPCIDNLELALQHSEADPSSLIEGLRISLNQFFNALTQLGVQKVDSNVATQFNPEFHEAVMRIPNGDIAPNHIVECFSEGYILNGRLLRAGKVSVAAEALAAPAEVNDTSTKESSESSDS